MRWVAGVFSIAIVGVAAAVSCTPAAPCRSTADCPSHVACLFQIGDCTGVGRCIGTDSANPCYAPPSVYCACSGGMAEAHCDDPRGYARAPATSSTSCFPTRPVPKDPCTSDDDCYGESCLFEIAEECSAVGHCILSPARCPEAPFACACDGTTIRTNGCDPTRASKPIRSRVPCEDAGDGTTDASLDATR